MGRYILAVATVLSPILTAVTSSIYNDWKTIVSGYVSARFVGFVTAVSISSVGLGIICLLGWLMWQLFTGRRR